MVFQYYALTHDQTEAMRLGVGVHPERSEDVAVLAARAEDRGASFTGEVVVVGSAPGRLHLFDPAGGRLSG